MTRFASVILVDDRGWVLLQERDEHPVHDPEKWGFAGGHVEEGEDFETAAHRELAEETGIVLAPGELRCWQEFRPWSEKPADVMQVFVARVSLTDDDIVCTEGRQIVFVEPRAALDLDLGGPASQVLPLFLGSADYERLRG